MPVLFVGVCLLWRPRLGAAAKFKVLVPVCQDEMLSKELHELISRAKSPAFLHREAEYGAAHALAQQVMHRYPLPLLRLHTAPAHSTIITVVFSPPSLLVSFTVLVLTYSESLHQTGIGHTH